MTTHTGTITNGSATITVDTTGMNTGSYDVATSYAQNNKYTNATKQSTLTLQQSSTWTNADITTTSTEWTTTPTSQGIVAQYNSYNIWKVSIPNNTTIEITGNKTGTKQVIDFRDKITSNSASVSVRHTYLDHWGSIGTGKIPGISFPWADGDFTVLVSRNNGVFTVQVNDGTPVSWDANSTVFDSACYVAFMKENSATSFTITGVRYKSN